MYAQLCKRLSKEAPNFEPENMPCTFRLLLLNQCKVEFENRSQNSELLERGSSPEAEERRLLAKRKMLGNIKFIGELGKLEILSENILHRCIQELLLDKKRRGDSPQDTSEDLECLCQILRTCGRILDTEKGRMLMDQYFSRMKILAVNGELPPRIRFMLRDVIELREDRWVPRKATSVEGPMPMNQIRPAEEESRGGGYMPPGGRDRRNQERDTERAPGNELFRSNMKIRRGIEDIMAGISIGSSSANLIPTHNDKFPFNPNGYGGGRDPPFRASQRAGSYMYNNRGNFNKHNQNNQHSNNNAQYNSSNKDLAPRFKKNLIAAREQNLGDVELRPAPNSMLFNQASMKPPPASLLLGGRAPQEPALSGGGLKQTPAPLLKETLPIKPVAADKPKQNKKDKGPSKEELQKKLNALVDEYLQGNVNLTEAVDTYKENKIPEKHTKDALLSVFNSKLESSDADCEKVCSLLCAFKEKGLLSGTACTEALKAMCGTLRELETGVEERRAALGVLLAQGVRARLLSLGELAAALEAGLHHPLFLLVLQQLHQALDKARLAELFKASKVNLLAQLPEPERTKERLAEILEERQLTFLYPLLRTQAELSRQLAADPTPAHFYKWIKENLDASTHSEPGFVNALVSVLLKYIMEKAGTGAAAADAEAGKRERQLLEPYAAVLQHFLHERTQLQVVAVYSLQTHCHALAFPKGLLLRWFIHLYELEVVEEEAFLAWKEDITDAYPGKGQALFQVNQWLTWLQEAESEDDEDEQDD